MKITELAGNEKRQRRAGPRQPRTAAAPSQAEIRRERVYKEVYYHERRISRVHTVGEDVYDALIRHNTKAQQTRAYREALRYLLIDRDFRDKQGKLLIPDYKVAVWCGDRAIRAYINGNFNTEAFLQALKADVLPDLEWSGYHGVDAEIWRGQCRYVANDNLNELVEHALYGFKAETRYDLLSMAKWNRRGAKINRDILVEKAQRQHWPYEQQENIAGYLHALPFGLFATQIEKNKDAAIAQVMGLAAELREDRARKLQSIFDNPQPIYSPGESGLNARLFAPDSLCDIDRGERRVLCEGWHEVDMKASYLAIAASVWNIRHVQDILRGGRDAWDTIAAELFIPESEREARRDGVKHAGMALLCGAGEGKANEILLDSGIRGFVKNSPTLLAIRAASRTASARAKEDGGSMTPFGWLVYGKNDDRDDYDGSHLSHVLSTYELTLIMPCFEVARKSSDFTIMMLQHDGFSIKLRREDRAEQVLSRLNAAMEPEARGRNIDTMLVYKT
ncbi:MAG: hypothetical protein WCD86_07835 [Ktedonobacteraceae bacterium]